VRTCSPPANILRPKSLRNAACSAVSGLSEVEGSACGWCHRPGSEDDQDATLPGLKHMILVHHFNKLREAKGTKRGAGAGGEGGGLPPEDSGFSFEKDFKTISELLVIRVRLV
jgi:hypothetical protein